MIASPYINVDQYQKDGTSSCAIVSLYLPVPVANDETRTVDIQQLLMNSAFMSSYRQNQLNAEKEMVSKRIEKICKSFVKNGGKSAGIVTSKVFVNIAAELVDLPFSDVLAQYSPSNEEIAFDLAFNNRIEVSVGKYLDDLDNNDVMFSLSIDNEPYAISSKDLYQLKNVLLEALAK